MSLYKKLKARQWRKEKLLPSEQDYVEKVERIVGYEVSLHLPAGAKFILGADDAEKILTRISPQAVD